MKISGVCTDRGAKRIGNPLLDNPSKSKISEPQLMELGLSMIKRARVLVLALLVFPTTGISEQLIIPDYNTAKRSYFWKHLYPVQGLSLYCSIQFNNGGYFINEESKPKKMTIEHVLPADWMASHFDCDNRKTCKNSIYKHAEADLHNLWPAHGSINSSRGDKAFSELDDSNHYQRFTDYCADYERRGKKEPIEAVVEPQDSSKGEIAISLLYMRDSYGFSLRGMEDMLLRWNKDDPVSDFEKLRNEEIFKIQDTRNHWVR